MSRIKLLGARLSSNPETEKVAHEQGVGGLVNRTTTGKLFYVVAAMVMDGMNPIVKSRNIWANDNGLFAISAADYDTFNKGQSAEGVLQRFDDVQPYQVDGKTYNHVKLLVFEDENPIDVINAWTRTQANRGTNAGNGILNQNGAPAAGATPGLVTSTAPIADATPAAGETPVVPLVPAAPVTTPTEG